MVSTGNQNAQDMSKKVAQAYTDENFFDTTSGITPQRTFDSPQRQDDNLNSPLIRNEVS